MELRGVRESPEGAGDDECLGQESPAESSIFVVNKAPERIFKVVFVGDSGVGKSSVIHRFCQNSFKSTFSATIGIDFQVKTMDLEGQVIALQLWDTAGQERFRSITKQYFRKADGIVIVYDVTNAQSYLHLREWLDSVLEGADEGSVKMLLGNKTDLLGGCGQFRAVEAESAKQLAAEYDESSLFFEVSAKSGASVNEAFIKFAMLLREKEDRQLKNAIRISADIEKKKGCCLNSK